MHPVRVGIIGMGGFAGSHHNTVARLEDRGVVKLTCACDPNLEAFSSERQLWRLAERGVRVFDSYRAMLEECRGDIDYVVIPTPIGLHAQMHEAATAYGIPAYVEKPPTLDHEELERMIAADRRARHAALAQCRAARAPAAQRGDARAARARRRRNHASARKPARDGGAPLPSAARGPSRRRGAAAARRSPRAR